MSKMNLMRNLFQLSAGNKAHGKTQGARRRRLFIEDLEARRVLATLYVDINDPGCDNTGGAPFCDIQAAIDAASDGDKIKVSRGTYTENINLNKDVYLRARSRVTIDGGGTGSVLEITASGSKVKGFRITNGEDGVVLDGVNGVVVKANRIYDNTDNGVELIDADDNEFEDNDVYDNLNNGFVVDGDSDGNTFEDNEAENNVFGFQVFGNNNTFEDNEAEDNSASGFSVLGNGNTFEDNEAEDNLQNGFDVFGNSNMFEDNEAEDNALIGFAVFGNDNTFEDNEAEDNFAGFAVFGDNNTFEDSEAEDNASSGFSDMGTGNSFEDNDDDDNGDDARDGVRSRLPSSSFPARRPIRASFPHC